MDQTTLLSQFEATGVVRLPGAFSVEAAAAMRTAVWRYAERKIGLRGDDRSTWPDGFMPISWKGLKRNPVFDALVGNDAVTGVLDEIFGAGGWQPPKPGAQVLVSLPKPGPWVLPDAWHMDCGFERATWPVFAVKLFAFFGEVGPHGGGTMLLPGSHRLVDRYRTTLPATTGGGMAAWHRLLRQDPWLAELLRGERQPDGGRSFVGQRHEVDGIPVEVVELTGEPGDVVVTHLHVYHSVSPNTGDQPRQMLGKTISAVH